MWLGRGMPDPINRGARPPLAVLAAAFALVVSGCISVDYSSLAPVLPARGAHAVWAQPFWRWIAFEYVTVLPGDTPVSCERKLRSSGVLTITSCTDVDDSWSIAFAQVIGALEHFFPGMEVGQAKVHLYPEGARALRRDRGFSRIDRIKVVLGFRYIPGDDRYLRYAARTFAHEYAHVALRSRNMSPEHEEFVAGVVESCVEYRAFGATWGAVFSMSSESPAEFDSAQRRSHRALLEADALVKAFGRGSYVNAPNVPFEEYCGTVLE